MGLLPDNLRRKLYDMWWRIQLEKEKYMVPVFIVVVLLIIWFLYPLLFHKEALPTYSP